MSLRIARRMQQDRLDRFHQSPLERFLDWILRR